ncbi:hypothetical protein FJ366_03370 [Candidatus Dependentiae bacterium]|nr:hypothetical protein [Candidatus Dependentiae bacterium]
MNYRYLFLIWGIFAAPSFFASGSLSQGEAIAAKSQILFNHSVVFPGKGMPHRVSGTFKKVDVLPAATTRVSLLSSRARDYLHDFDVARSHAYFLEKPYFYRFFSEVLKASAQLYSTKATRISTSVLFEYADPEDSVVVDFDFERRNNKLVCVVTFNTLSGRVDAQLVNLVKSSVCDDSFVSKHWGKGVFAGFVGLATAFRKELPLGIGKKFQSFYEQAKREIARLYPGQFGEWQTFYENRQFAVSIDGSSCALVLISAKDPHLLAYQLTDKCEEKLPGVRKIILVVEREDQANTDYLASLSHSTVSSFPLITFFEKRRLVGENSFENRPLDLDATRVLIPIAEQVFWFWVGQDYKLKERLTVCCVAQDADVRPEETQITISYDENVSKDGPGNLDLSVLKKFHQKIFITRSASNKIKLVAGGESSEFDTIELFAERIRQIINSLEPEEVDPFATKFEKEVFFEDFFYKFFCHSYGAIYQRRWPTERNSYVTYPSREVTLRDWENCNISISEPDEECASTNYIKITVVQGPGEIFRETLPQEKTKKRGMINIVTHSQEIFIYRNEGNKLVLVANNTSEVLDDAKDLFKKVKDLAKSLVAKHRVELSLDGIDGTSDRPRAFQKFSQKLGSAFDLHNAGIALKSDETFNAWQKNEDGSFDVMAIEDGVRSTKTISAEILAQLRVTNNTLTKFVTRLKSKRREETTKANQLLVDPRADGDSWQKIAYLISQIDVLSVETFKKTEIAVQKALDAVGDDFYRFEQMLKKCCDSDQMPYKIEEALKAVAVEGVLISSVTKSSFCGYFDIQLLIGDEQFSVNVANPLGYWHKRWSERKTNCSVMQITRTAIVPAAGSSSEMKLCLRPGAFAGGPLNDRFVVIIEKKYPTV